MLRILSSALGDFLVKLSQASYRMAEGEVEPGVKIDEVDPEKAVSTRISGGSDDTDLALSG